MACKFPDYYAGDSTGAAAVLRAAVTKILAKAIVAVRAVEISAKRGAVTIPSLANCAVYLLSLSLARLPINLLYSAFSAGEQIISLISKLGGCK